MVVYLWPCNVKVWALWQQVQTQWRVGVGGATGLDYAGVQAHLRAIGLRGKHYSRAWRCIRACEAGSLEGWAEKRRLEEASKPT